MTRLVVVLTLFSAAVTHFDPAGYRWVGISGLAIAVLLGALKIRSVLGRRAARRTLEGLRLLHPNDFEFEVGRWLHRDGWRVEHRGGTGDGGIDIIARKRGQTIAVQCKRYAETAAVSAAQVRDLYGAAIAESATAAVLVTTGRISGPAKAWAEALPGGPAMAFHDLHCLPSVARGVTRL